MDCNIINTSAEIDGLLLTMTVLITLCSIVFDRLVFNVLIKILDNMPLTPTKQSDHLDLKAYTLHLDLKPSPQCWGFFFHNFNI